MKKEKGILFYIKSYKFNSVFIKNFIIVLFLFFVPFLFTGYLYYSNTKNMLNHEITTENAELVRKAKDLSDTMIKQANYVASYLMSTTNVQMFMMNDWFNEVTADNDMSLKNFMNMVPLLYNNIDSVYIYSAANDMVSTSNGIGKYANFQDNSWFATYEELTDAKLAIVPRTKNNIFPQYISLIRPVFEDGEKWGCVVINMDVKKLLELFYTDKYADRQSVMIADPQGRILACTNRQYFSESIQNIDFLKGVHFGSEAKLIKHQFENTEYIISVEKSGNYDMKYINVTSMDVYKDRMNYILWLLVLLFAALIIISFFVALIIAFNSFKPVQEIISVLEAPDKYSDFSDGVRTGNLNELKYIISSMLKTIRHNTEMETELAGKLVQLDKSHFAMLQAQINPHFLYNTLETINWMAVDLSDKIDNPVSGALSKLGEFFRVNTQSSNYFMSVKDEIQQTKIYTDILLLRYDDMFTVHWDISPGILSKQVIKVTLQPFIENAVYHGIKPKGSGTIMIKGWEENDKIILTITDDGVGMTKRKVGEINKTLHMDFKESDLHIGIYNVYRRYRIVFDDNCKMTVRSAKDAGTSVTLTFPCVKLT